MRIFCIILLMFFSINIAYAKDYVRVTVDGSNYYCSGGRCLDSNEYANRKWAYQKGLENSISQDLKIERRDSKGNLIDEEGYRIDENGNRINTWKDWLDPNRAIDKVRDKVIYSVSKGGYKILDSVESVVDK